MQQVLIFHLVPQDWLSESNPSLFDEGNVFSLEKIWKKYLNNDVILKELKKYFKIDPNEKDNLCYWETPSKSKVCLRLGKDNSLEFVSFHIDIYKFGSKEASRLCGLAKKLHCIIFSLGNNEYIVPHENGAKLLTEIVERNKHQ